MVGCLSQNDFTLEKKKIYGKRKRKRKRRKWKREENIGDEKCQVMFLLFFLRGEKVGLNIWLDFLAKEIHKRGCWGFFFSFFSATPAHFLSFYLSLSALLKHTHLSFFFSIFPPLLCRVITLWRDESLIPLGRKFNIPSVRLIFLRYTAHSWNYSMMNRIFKNNNKKKKILLFHLADEKYDIHSEGKKKMKNWMKNYFYICHDLWQF